MPASYNPNLEILETAVKLLGPLADEVVFLGGCATGLLVTDSADGIWKPLVCKSISRGKLDHIAIGQTNTVATSALFSCYQD